MLEVQTELYTKCQKIKERTNQLCLKTYLRKKSKTNTKYQVGDTVYVLGYEYRDYYSGNIKELVKQVKLFKMKIIKIEFDGSNKPKYFTNANTCLEQNFDGYYGFDSWDTIKQAIDNFVDDDYKLRKD